MPTAPQLIDPFHRELYTRLVERLEARVDQLSRGSAMRITEDTADTDEKYAAQVSYIQALRDVLAVCEEIEQERYGVKKDGEE